MPKISVIIPVYNVEEYLKECLDSVINQTFNDMEIICIDDKTPDNSLQILEEYAKNDNRVKIIHHKINKGLGASRNTGMNVATGEYIFFLDSDDSIMPDTLEKLYNTALKTNSDVIISKGTVYTNDTDEYSLERVKSLNEWLKCNFKDNYKVTLDNFQLTATEYPCVAWGRLYKHKFLKDNHITFIEKKIIHEDNGFWMKLCSCLPDMSYIEDCGVLYRIRENAITSEIDKEKNSEKKFKHMKLVLKDTFKYITKYRPKKLGNSCKAFIKNAVVYEIFYIVKIGSFLEYKWSMNNKYIKLFNKQIFSEYEQNSENKVGRIFKIRIYKMKIKKIPTEF